VADIPGIRKGGVAVFGVTDQASGTERAIVLAEIREADPAARAALQACAHEVTTDIAGTSPDEIVLAPPRKVPAEEVKRQDLPQRSQGTLRERPYRPCKTAYVVAAAMLGAVGGRSTN
jgi:hypothetical protein